MEHFFTELITGKFFAILTVVFGTFEIHLIDFLSPRLVLLNLNSDFHHDLFTKRTNAIILIVFAVGLDCSFDSFAVKIQLSEFLIDLGDGHFAQVLVKLYFVLFKYRIRVFLPNLLYQVKGRIHFVVIGLNLFQPFNSLELKPPCPTFHRCSIQIVSKS